MSHPDVPAEQAHVDLSYQRLAAMREAASSMLQDALSERGGTFQAVTERDIRVRNSLTRLEQLEIGMESLVFGRIDAEAPSGPDETFHIGRLAVSGPDHEPLVVDWRAPVAEPFYRATGAHPMGLSRRRHFLTEGQRVIDLEDELFDHGGQEGGRLGLSGPQVLLSTLERSRTGRMRDIVATVQREQDEIIRSPLPGVLIVQGGPGTGKTAVALHRAAYLLYTYRFPLEGQGVLVLGPNPTFLRYIEHVLPSLDETGVELSTVAGLYSSVRPRHEDSEDVARLKGDPRMAKVIAKAVHDRQRPLRRPVVIPFGTRLLRLSVRQSEEAVAAVRRRAGTHNARRRTLEAILWRVLAAQIDTGSQVPAGTAPGGTDVVTPEDLGRSLRHVPQVVEILERMWPILTPEQLVRDLFGAAPLLDLAAGRLLGPAERALLLRDRGSASGDVSWTNADLALLDEARALLGPPRRRPSEDEVPRTYGHIVVDEAQDLTPMQLRMISRRSLSGSMTVVGDLAQATGSWVPPSWAQVAEYLAPRRGWRLSELSVNYRTPAEIMGLAGRILEQAAPGMRPPESVRTGGVRPLVVAATSTGAALPADTLSRSAAAAVQDALADLDGRGTAAAVVPPSLLDAVARALAALDIEFGDVERRTALEDAVTLLTIGDAKGLEFDAVVVVEPARIVRESAQGLRSLYVACTRATRSLVVVHAEGLPASMADAVQTPA